MSEDWYSICPHCRHRLHVHGRPPEGARLTCPGCRTSYPISAVVSRASPEPLRRSRARLWAGFLLGGVLLMMGISIGLAVYLGEKTANSGRGQQSASSSISDQTNADSELLREETPSKPPWLPQDKQTRVNAAIDRGVAWVRKKQTPEGSWTDSVRPLGQTFTTGLAALPALTLLECGISRDDPQVIRAAQLVRDTAPKLDWTYDLALAILFLDRLQQEEDRPRIRSMILRLIAGQQGNGGWNYHCPVPNHEEELMLLAALKKTRPASPLDLFQQGGKKMELGLFVKAVGTDGDAASDPVQQLEPLKLPSTDRPSRELSEAERWEVLESVPPQLRRVPALQAPAPYAENAGDSDNSNTQFAVLGLLVAPRYEIPLEQTLARVAQRFHATQRDDGEWMYGPRRPSNPQPSMTGAGLLGLAVKYGLVLNSSRHQGQAIIIQDAAIDKGLKALSEYIGHPLLWGRPGSHDGEDRLNLYALWSIERVGALYHVRRINGKEWYPWGVEQILEWQEADGAWRVGQYGGTDATDTCFALLFLRRADFARDLSRKLEFFTEGKSLAEQNRGDR